MAVDWDGESICTVNMVVVVGCPVFDSVSWVNKVEGVIFSLIDVVVGVEVFCCIVSSPVNVTVCTFGSVEHTHPDTSTRRTMKCLIAY